MSLINTTPQNVLVLNVDDNEAARYARSRVLYSAGYRVLESGTGAEALRLAREAAPQLALIDVNMPDMNGVEVCRILKSDSTTASIMVMLISAARVRPGDKVTGLEEGADGYLVEPIGSEELLATVKALLRISRTEECLAHSTEALRRSQQHLEWINNNVPALIAYVGKDRRYHTCNQAYTNWFGVSRQDIVGKTMREVWGERAWSAIGPRVEAAFAGETASYETEVDGLPNGSRWIHAIYTPHRDAQNQILGIIVMVTDMTARKQAEEALRESEERFRKAFQRSSVGKAQLDALNGRFIEVNEQFCHLTGYPREELLTLTPADLTHPDDRQSDAFALKSLLTGECEELRVEKRYVR
jgi:PAS domain S-box-containing protein